ETTVVGYEQSERAQTYPASQTPCAYFCAAPSPTVRNPILASILSGSRSTIRRVASAPAFKKFPPRTTGLRSSTHVPVQSETFPPMSNTPYGLRSSGQLPTAVQPEI